MRGGCGADGTLDATRFSEPMPWIGIYVAAASLAGVVAMAVDALHGIRHGKIWFPSKFMSLNSTSLTLIAVAIKLSVDLNTAMPRRQDQLVKLCTSVFICTIMGNSITSLGGMDTTELAMNIMALWILIITMIVNICIQLFTGVIYVFWIEHVCIMLLMLVLLMIMSSSALAVPTIKRYLELKYQKVYGMALKESEHGLGESELVFNNLKKDLTRQWMMARTSNPQFVLGRSVTSTASGAFCLPGALVLAEAMIRSYYMPWSFHFCQGQSDYKWSTVLILIIQTAGVGVGTFAPATRWFTAIKFRCPSMAKSEMESCRKEFEVELYWIKSLLLIKECPLSLYIHNRRCRRLAQDAKTLIIGFCIRMQVGIVLTSKMIRLVSIYFASRIVICCNFIKRLEQQFKNSNSSISSGSGSESNPGFKLDLRRFVLHLEGENDLVELMVKENRDATDHWIQRGEKVEQKNITKLLEKSSVSQGFVGVGAFESDKIPPLHAEEPPNCWALPVVTLASIATALPNIKSCVRQQFISAVNEGLLCVKLIEKNLDTESDNVNVRKAADSVWLGVDLYQRWLDVDLRKLSLEEISPIETIQRLAYASKCKYEELKLRATLLCLKPPSKWPIGVLAAYSMYRISHTMLLNYGGRTNFTSERVLEELSTIISDIIGACLTNFPQIMLKCCNSGLEDREDNVRHAVFNLGKMKKMLKMLDKLPHTVLDLQQRASIDNWRRIHKGNTSFIINPFLSPEGETEISMSESSELHLTIE